MISTEELNPELFPDKNSNEERIESLKAYTSAAKDNGLIPLFDLVLNHVGRTNDSTSSLETTFSSYLKQPDSGKWQDTLEFDYSSEENIDYLIVNLWRPFIEKYISYYGFLGVRVDAITNVNEVLQKKIYSLIKEIQPQSIIMGELMVPEPEKYIPKLKNIGFTHIFAPCPFYHNFSKQSSSSAKETWETPDK